MTDNDAAKALDSLIRVASNSAGVCYDPEAVVILRTALANSAKVDGLLDDLEIIKKECMSVEAMKTPARSLGSILFTINEAIQKYKGMSND